MADANNITLRSDKTQFLTFEEMDLNLVQLKELITEFTFFVNTVFANHVDDFNQFRTDAQFLDLTATGEIDFSQGVNFRLPVWTTANRPVTDRSAIGFNSTLGEFEGWDGIRWAPVGGNIVNIDSTTDLDIYPTFVSNTTGTAKDIYVDNDKLKYNPAQGRIQFEAIIMPIALEQNLTIPSGFAGVLANKDISVGVELTVEPDAVLTIV